MVCTGCYWIFPDKLIKFTFGPESLGLEQSNMNKRNILYLLAGLSTGLYLAFLSTRPNDFDIFMDAALKLKAGADPYGPPYIRTLHYLYSPFFATILLLVSWVPLPLIKWLWLVFNLYAWWRTWKCPLRARASR